MSNVTPVTADDLEQDLQLDPVHPDPARQCPICAKTKQRESQLAFMKGAYETKADGGKEYALLLGCEAHDCLFTTYMRVGVAPPSPEPEAPQEEAGE